MAEGDNHDLLVEMRTDLKHVKRELVEMNQHLKDGRERMRQHDLKIQEHDTRLDSVETNHEKHCDGHRWFVGAVIGFASLAVAVILAVAKLTGVI